jgi:multisubunit Na+/H+ antiporter MnhG subunit
VIELLLILVLTPSIVGIPGALAGWWAGRRRGQAAALLAVFLLLVALAILALGPSAWDGDPFGAWVMTVLLAVVGINACTAVGAVALARHAHRRDAHLDPTSW